MGVAGWRFAHTKRNPGGRAAVVAVLEVWPAICSVAVAVGSMIMIGIMLYNDHALQRFAAVTTAGERLARPRSPNRKAPPLLTGLLLRTTLPLTSGQRTYTC